MDFAMNSIDTETDRTAQWDFRVEKGKLITYDNNVATQQRAFVATYLQRGTVPQVPSAGNQWVELMLSQISPQQLNSQIRESIIEYTGGLSYLPKYTDKDGKIIVEVVKV